MRSSQLEGPTLLPSTMVCSEEDDISGSDVESLGPSLGEKETININTMLYFSSQTPTWSSYRMDEMSILVKIPSGRIGWCGHCSTLDYFSIFWRFSNDIELRESER